MSTLGSGTGDPGGVYFPPSVGLFSVPQPQQRARLNNEHPDQQNAKNCSVRGCNSPLSSNSLNKMCDGCRERHRLYASTKRARRKLEKATLNNLVDTRNLGSTIDLEFIDSRASQPESSSDPNTNGREEGFISSQYDSGSVIQSDLVSTTSWQSTIDPVLYNLSTDQQLTTNRPTSLSRIHYTKSTPLPSSSSELANALILPNTTIAPSVSTAPTEVSGISRQSATSEKESDRPERSAANKVQSPINNPPRDDLSEEEQVSSLFQSKAQIDAPEPLSSRLPDQSTESSSIPNESPDTLASAEVLPSRYCSVKGCKTVIPASYQFKMCPHCRTRYRTYGTTKRARWKAERAAFDDEMADLRASEDQRRKDKGLLPLLDSPEDLLAWEASVLGGKGNTEKSEVGLILGGQSIGGANTQATNSSSNPQSKPSHDLSGLQPAPLVLTDLSLSKNPLRMCTVSHCHTLLLGSYPYKRCEQHRLQNRYHSKLKRVREKVVKAVPPPAGMDDSVACAEAKSTNKIKLKSRSNESSNERMERGGRCVGKDCCNLFALDNSPELCDNCQQLGSRAEDGRDVSNDLDSVADCDMNEDVDPRLVAMNITSGDETPTDRSSGITSHKIPTPDLLTNSLEVPASPALTNAPSPGIISQTLKTNHPDLNDPATFRSYQPVSTSSAIGRILARNPLLSVDAFTEYLPNGVDDIRAPSQSQDPKSTSNEERSKTVPTPVIPISEPFVYKPSKKSRTENDDESSNAETERLPSTALRWKDTRTIGVNPTIPVSSEPNTALSYPSALPMPFPYPFFQPPQGIPYPPPFPGYSASLNPVYPTPFTQPYPYMTQRIGYTPGLASGTGQPYGPPGYMASPHAFPYIGPPGSCMLPYGYVPIPASGSSPTPQPLALDAGHPTANSASGSKASADSRRSQKDAKFSYYHYGYGDSTSATTLNGKRKRKNTDAQFDNVKGSSNPSAVIQSVVNANNEKSTEVASPSPPITTNNAGNDSTVEIRNEAVPDSIRRCGKKQCHRLIPPKFSGNLCERCKHRFKKHLAQTRKRLKLEPSKSLLATNTLATSTPSMA